MHKTWGTPAVKNSQQDTACIQNDETAYAQASEAFRFVPTLGLACALGELAGLFLGDAGLPELVLGLLGVPGLVATNKANPLASLSVPATTASMTYVHCQRQMTLERSYEYKDLQDTSGIH